MDDKKYYIVCQHAEGCTYGVVALTDAELEVIKKFLDYEVVVWVTGVVALTFLMTNLTIQKKKHVMPL